jgi:hypothetical protein
MPLPPQRSGDSEEFSASNLFVNRDSESAALRGAIRDHRDRMHDDTIDSESLRNVLTFYGVSGIGKSSLSTRLESWLHGDDSATLGWSEPPPLTQLATARWNLNDSAGNLDAIPRLVTLRDALHQIKPSWPAFDLAFAAYFSATRPGESPIDYDRGLKAPTRKHHGAFSAVYLDLIVDLGRDVGADFDWTLLKTAASLTTSVIRRIAQAAGRSVAEWRTLKSNPHLLDVVERALRVEPGGQDPGVVGDIVWQLSLEIDAMKPSDRPEIVVFIDHFERIQDAPLSNGEPLLNRMIASLPYTLFVITGQNEVDWYRADRLSLLKRGKQAWPGLVPGSTESPRQHRIDQLSDADTRRILTDARSAERLLIADETIEQLVQDIKGWPAHIDVVLGYARAIAADTDRQITIDDLGGPLTEVVGRLLAGLASDERRAALAACVLPFFDVELVTAVAQGVDEGAVHRLTRRSLVMDNEGSSYPFKIHDSIRSAVRRVGYDVNGGWSESDWAAAAARAMEHAEGRFQRSMTAADDVGQMSAIALGLHLGVDNEVSDEWLTTAVRNAPSITGLASVIPSSTKQRKNPDLLALTQYIEVLDRPASDEVLAELERLSRTDAPIARSAGLWKAYRLRLPLMRTDEALVQLEDLARRFPEKESLFLRQFSVTLAQGRRFRDAMDSLDRLSEQNRRDTAPLIRRSHGHVAEGLANLRERCAAETKNRRFRLELETTLSRDRARVGLATTDELEHLYDVTVAVGHRPGEREMLQAIAYTRLRQDDVIDDTLDRLRQFRLAGFNVPAETEIAALSAYVSGDTSRIWPILDEHVLKLPGRSDSWIFAEVLLEHLGFDLPEVPTQWLEPYEDVRARWLAIADGIARRNPDRSPAVADVSNL